MAFKVNKAFMATKVEEDTKVSTGASKEVKATTGKKGTSRAKQAEQVSQDKEDSKDTPVRRTRSSKSGDDYKAEVVKEMLVKDNGRGYKEYLELSVKRFGEEGIPYVHFSSRQESEVYTGYKKGKHISFPLELLYDFKDLLDELDKECDEKHIE